jgi:7-cyano-7-deazaguanine synthase
MKKAVILYSGGLDSTTCLAIAKGEGYEPYAMSFAYGQRHKEEVEFAKANAVPMGAVEHLVVEIDLRKVGGSALTADIAVPKGGVVESAIPVTYVPARNTIFLSFALGWAEVLGAFDIFIGVNALDYSGYPDCRPAFVRAFESLASVATKAGVEGARFTVHTPLMTLDKAGIIRLGCSLGVDYALTHSCYDPSPAGEACGECDSCRLRAKGFREAGVPDPTRYAPR